MIFAANAVDILLTHDHADSSSVFLYHTESLAIFRLPFSIELKLMRKTKHSLSFKAGLYYCHAKG